MPTYPLNLPAAPYPARTSFRIKRAVAVAESPFTGQQQAVVYPYSIWTAEIQLPPMRRELAGEWQSFLLMLQGRRGTFLMPDFDALVPRGSARGGVVNGAGQTGNVLNVSGLGANKGLLPGDYLQVGSGASSRLHMVTLAHGGSGGGTASFTIEPAIKVAPANGSAVVMVRAQGLWRLSSNDIGWDSDEVSTYGFNFSCHEAF